MTDPGLAALLLSYRLKSMARAGWVRRGVTAPESVAAHTWGVSFLVLVLCPPELNRALAQEYATLHDLAECLVGDLTPFDGVDRAEKARRELDAMRVLCADLPRGAEILAVWERYEAQEDPESQFVRQLDRLDMALQARLYRDGGAVGMEEFLESAAACIEHPELVPWLAAAASTKP